MGVRGGLAQRVGVRVVTGGLVGVVEVGGDDLGDLRPLVREGGTQMLGRAQVPSLALGSREHVVGDRADEGLGEGVLAALGRQLVGPYREDFFADERGQDLLDPGRVHLRHRLDGRAREGLSEHGALLHDSPLTGREGVESGGDERRQAGRDLQRAQLADEVQGTVGAFGEHALVDEAADRLDGVEGDALRPLDDAPTGGVGQVGHEPVQHLADDLVAERIEGQRAEAAAAQHEAAPVGAVRPCEHEEEDGVIAGPLEEVVEEVDHAGVRPLQILHDHDDGQVLGEALEEEAPAGEELLAGEHLGRRQPEQLPDAGGDELTVGGIGDPSLEPGAETLGYDVEGVVLADEQPRPDHLRERPVADALAVGEAATGVPEDVAGEAVDVLEELPGEAGLPDTGHARDEHEAGGAALGGSVEELLHQAEFVVPPAERRLEDPGALRAGDGGHDAGRLIEAEGLALAFQVVLAGVGVGDGRRRGVSCGLVDVAGAGGGHRLDPGSGVDAIADDEAFLRRLRRGRLAGDDADAGAQLRGVLVAVGGDGGEELEGGTHGALGVVLVGDGRTPDGHDGVADKLLDDTAVAPHDGAGEIEVAREELAHLLRIT